MGADCICFVLSPSVAFPLWTRFEGGCPRRRWTSEGKIDLVGKGRSASTFLLQGVLAHQFSNLGSACDRGENSVSNLFSLAETAMDVVATEMFVVI